MLINTCRCSLSQLSVYMHAPMELDRMTNDLFELTARKPMSLNDFVKLHIAAFTRNATH